MSNNKVLLHYGAESFTLTGFDSLEDAAVHINRHIAGLLKQDPADPSNLLALDVERRGEVRLLVSEYIPLWLEEVGEGHPIRARGKAW